MAPRAERPLAVVAVRLHGDPGRQPRDHRVLVDRLWPRGVRRAAVDLDEWAKDLAPSTELRRWYGHEPERFAAFADRYRAELAAPDQAARCCALLARAAGRRLVLLTATRDLEHSAASVLREVLEDRPVALPPA